MAILNARASERGSISMAYRTARSVEGYGYWCVQQSVRAVCDIGWTASKNIEDAIQLHDRSLQTIANCLDFDAGLSYSTVVWGMWRFVYATIGAWGSWYRASSVFELLIWINDLRSIVTLIIMLGSGFGDHLGVSAIGETLKRKQPTVGNHTPPPPQALTLSKYGIPMFIGIHIVHNERIEAIGFDGEFWIISDMWILAVVPMSEFWEPRKKVHRVDIKVLRQKCWVRTPTIGLMIQGRIDTSILHYMI